MRFGLELPCGGDGVTAGLLVELGVRAEAAGWDGVFFEDYLVYYRGDKPATYDPWVVLTAVAARTERVRLGTTVSGLLARDPVKLAREAATLNALAPVPYKLTDTDQWADFTAGEIRDLVRGDGFDVAVGGRRRLPDPAAEKAAVETARRGGATWWLEFVAPGTPEEMIDAVSAGPVAA